MGWDRMGREAINGMQKSECKKANANKGMQKREGKKAGIKGNTETTEDRKMPKRQKRYRRDI